ncbi:MAG: hypothetical protein ACI898_001033, partial [Flavobacteriales bacterium]
MKVLDVLNHSNLAKLTFFTFSFYGLHLT